MDIQEIKNQMIMRQLDENNSIKIKINGDCMAPFVYNGDSVIISKSIDYKLGDIVLINSNNDFKLHRIIKKNKKEIITKGDNSLFIDLFNKNVVGVLSSVIYLNENINIKNFKYAKKRIAVLSYIESIVHTYYCKRGMKYFKKISYTITKIRKNIAKKADMKGNIFYD